MRAHSSTPLHPQNASYPHITSVQVRGRPASSLLPPGRDPQRPEKTRHRRSAQARTRRRWWHLPPPVTVTVLTHVTSADGPHPSFRGAPKWQVPPRPSSLVKGQEGVPLPPLHSKTARPTGRNAPPRLTQPQAGGPRPTSRPRPPHRCNCRSQSPHTCSPALAVRAARACPHPPV